MIAYLKGLCTVLDDIAANNRLPVMKFNSYMISVLVIFYLQMNHNFPKINQLSNSSKVTLSAKFSLHELVRDFFRFYGKKYELKNHLISLNVGRWQEKQLQKSQTIFSPEQKRFIFHCIKC